jgi:hypothetical protein
MFNDMKIKGNNMAYPDQRAEVNDMYHKPLNKSGVLDRQEGGNHYKKYGDYQPWQVFGKWLTPEELKGYMKGTVIAYLARESDKGGREDIKKAMHTIQLYLKISGEDGK